MEELFCIGCGAPIQTENKEGLGYTPQSALEKGLETGEVYCQRCFRLRHYNEITDVHLTDDDFLKLLHEVGDSDALVVNVVDIFDFNGSVIPGLPRFVAGNDVLLVGNKKDILPKSVKDSKVTHWLMERAHEEGMRPVDVVLTSVICGSGLSARPKMPDQTRILLIVLLCGVGKLPPLCPQYRQSRPSSMITRHFIKPQKKNYSFS